MPPVRPLVEMKSTLRRRKDRRQIPAALHNLYMTSRRKEVPARHPELISFHRPGNQKGSIVREQDIR